jgi:hypothetical protein
MDDSLLVTVELRFKTSDDPDAIGDRVRESVKTIVGPEALEEFRLRVLPLAPPKGKGHLREV